MKDQRPSQTAHLVALGRAMADAGVSHLPHFRDPTARVFLTEKGTKSLAKTEAQIRAGKRGIRFEMARVMADMMALRTEAIDAALRAAIAAGTTQLVILGAGYDGRAWRMPELGGVRVFEVDHPTTQADKRRQLGELPSPFGMVTFVAVDFERESLGVGLDRAGHDRFAPTCWIWEGVVVYLTRDAMRSTVAGIADRSAAGSTLIVNYHTRHQSLLARLMLRLIGEPQLSTWTPAEMAAELQSVGLSVTADTGMSDWNGRFAQGEGEVARGVHMRIAVATAGRAPVQGRPLNQG